MEMTRMEALGKKQNGREQDDTSATTWSDQRLHIDVREQYRVLANCPGKVQLNCFSSPWHLLIHTTEPHQTRKPPGNNAL